MFSAAAYRSQSTGLVRTDHGDSPKSLYCLERLAENFVLAHHVCTNCQTGREGYWQPFWDKGNRNGYAIHDQCRDIYPVGVGFSEPSSPVLDNQQAGDHSVLCDADLPQNDDHDNHSKHD